ncbi:MAG: radical SAM family heme chaperone HemW [bacterium]|nr:radical SAM family heme chaperone HemW [bacterium]
MNIQAGIYIHFPFCTTKCNYCGFYSIPNHPERVSEYLTMLEREMEIQAPLSQQFTMDTIFLGGGTPSLMTIEQLERIFSQLHDNFTVSEHPEITLETNPTSISAHKAEQIFSTRINRLSLGCQSFDDTLLKTLGRNHKAYDNIKIYSLFRNAGFKNISIDLIFSIPGQTMNQWIDSLSQTIALRPEHISLYCLSYEEGTQFTRLIRTGKITAVDEDTELQMFRTCIDMLTDAGYVQYEISNFALPGYQSRHNTLYWKNLPCIGLGTSILIR